MSSVASRSVSSLVWVLTLDVGKYPAGFALVFGNSQIF